MTNNCKQYDIIVAGGGSAGTFAAIAAARRGVKVLLIEELNALGGVSTSGMVNEWFSHFEGLGDIIRNEMANFETFIDGDAVKYRYFTASSLS